MLKIVVFDIGWGGEVVADYLASELGTVEIIRATSWRGRLYEIRDEEVLYREIEMHLREYIGKVDLIVFGGYVTSLTLGFLKVTYPQQKFVGLSINYHKVLKSRNRLGHVILLMNDLLVRKPIFEEIRQELSESTIVVPDCSGWEELIDIGEMSTDVLRSELQSYFALTLPSAPKKDAHTAKISSVSSPLREQIIAFLASGCGANQQQKYALASDMPSPKALVPAYQQVCHQSSGIARVDNENESLIRPDAILLLNTHFWDIKDEISEVFGAGVSVMDFRNLLLHDVCRALELRGVHGERSKW